MKRIIQGLVPLLLLGASAGCAQPKVVQGTVVSVDTNAHVLVVKDELAPNAELSFAIGDAEIGGKISAGDVVRIAYDQSGTTRHASRVMNLTRQKNLAKH